MKSLDLEIQYRTANPFCRCVVRFGDLHLIEPCNFGQVLCTFNDGSAVVRFPSGAEKRVPLVNVAEVRFVMLPGAFWWEVKRWLRRWLA